jgi:hypothetical protein
VLLALTLGDIVQADNRCACCIPLSGYFLTPSFYLFNFSLSRFMSSFTFASIVNQVPICHFQHKIAEASDDVARKYYKETPKDDRSDSSVAAVMKAAAKSK